MKIPIIKGRKNSKKILFIVLIITLVILNSTFSASAIPIPYGIDGTIYELDGITEVRKGIDFYVQNLNNGHIINGKTGYGSSGSYSVAISGNNGDIILIKAWNKYNQVNITLPLYGVMYNVNLLLNMTYPQIPPNIISEPMTTAIEDQLYTYDVEAFDENEEDVLDYTLIEAPTGMAINQSSGLVKWTPLQMHVGSNYIIAQVTDGLFLVNQSFTINVENVNDKPEIISIPIADATEDVNYLYGVNAVDEDNDLLFYYLTISPDGMVINGNTGLINWTPNNNDIGTHNILVQVSDGNLIDEQEFTINVVNVNDLPVITSLPATNAVQDEPYNYDVEAYDIDKDILIYSLENYPQGMEINNINGNITWMPSNDDVGLHNIAVKVSDDDGFTLQPYTLVVENVNDRPVINSTPITTARAFKLYEYDVDAYDADNDALTYSLIKKPNRMEINRGTGLIEWFPRLRDLGQNEVIVEVSDGELTDTQEFTILVTLIKRGGSIGSYSESTPAKKLQYGEFKITINTFSNTLSNTDKIALKELNERPEDAQKISRRVYKYLRVEGMETIEEAILNFTVDLKWLKENGIKYEDIVLIGYADGEWEDSKTEYAGNDEKFAYYTAYYTANTPGFSYFAITVKEGAEVKNILKPKISSINVPYRVSGTIYKFGKFGQADSWTKLTVENLNTSEVVNAQTGIGPNTGAYYVLLHGTEGDLIKIRIIGIDKEFLTTLKDIDNLDFMLNHDGTGFSIITGWGIFEKFSLEKINLLPIIILIFIILAIRKRHKFYFN